MAASASTPPLCFGRRRCTCLLRRKGLRQKAPIGAVKLIEEIMRVLTLCELMRLSKIELCDLLTQITVTLSDLLEARPERAAAEINLRNI
jgi:hypothetical protein